MSGNPDSELLPVKMNINIISFIVNCPDQLPENLKIVMDKY